MVARNVLLRSNLPNNKIEPLLLPLHIKCIYTDTCVQLCPSLQWFPPLTEPIIIEHSLCTLEASMIANCTLKSVHI